MSRYAYRCPICEQEMIKTGFCHLECPAGHYQEVCSDLFKPERIEPRTAREKEFDESDRPSANTAGTIVQPTHPEH